MTTIKTNIKNGGCETGTVSSVSPQKHETVNTTPNSARNAPLKTKIPRPGKRIQKDCIQSKVVPIRFSEHEYSRLKSIADDNAFTISAFIRSRALGAVIVSKGDAKLVSELCRQGGLIKHYINTMRDVIGHEFDSTEADKTLFSIRAALAVLSGIDPVTGEKL